MKQDIDYADLTVFHYRIILLWLSYFNRLNGVVCSVVWETDYADQVQKKGNRRSFYRKKKI